VLQTKLFVFDRRVAAHDGEGLICVKRALLKLPQEEVRDAELKVGDRKMRIFRDGRNKCGNLQSASISICTYSGCATSETTA